MKDTVKTTDFSRQLAQAGRMFIRYRLIIFVIFVGAVYGYTLWHFNSLNSAEPNSAQVSASVESKAEATPHIDPAVVNKIEKLKDNSTNVRALFNDSRNNPFNN